MFRRTLFYLAVAIAIQGSPKAFGFALEGNPLGYESTAFGYEATVPLRGYPRTLGDESRITIPNVYYACDQSFLDYFGQLGREEIQKAFGYLNDLPPFSSMSEDLTEFPQVTYRENYKADALLLHDLKSQIMTFLLWDIGLTAPEYYMWSVKGRVLPAGRQCPNYQWIIIMRNFDPVSWEPSSYVNGALYTYTWIIQCPNAPDLTTPAPTLVDPTSFGFSAVAGVSSAVIGQYYTGLSRDDIGGLRYIYHTKNYNFDSLPANTLVGGGGGVPFSIVDPNATNAPVGNTAALRTGIDKLNFEERPYDSLLSQFFEGFTNQFSSTLVTNGIEQVQTFGRPVLVPDIIIQAADLDNDGNVGLLEATLGRPANYISNTTGVGPSTLDMGGGTPVTYTLNKVGTAFAVDNPFFLTELEIDPSVFDYVRWGTFDGSTNEPVLYPTKSSIVELEDLVLGSD